MLYANSWLKAKLFLKEKKGGLILPKLGESGGGTQFGD